MKTKVFVLCILVSSLIGGTYFLWVSNGESHNHSHEHSEAEEAHSSEEKKNRDEQKEQQPMQGEHSEEKVLWTKEKTQTANIQVRAAEPGIIRNFIRASGKILIHPDHIAYIIPKVGGVVKEIRKNQGDSVEIEEVLAVIESKEMAEAKSNYLATLKKLKLRQTFLQREEGLKEISPEQDYLNARAAVEEGSIDEELAKQRLYSIGLSEEEVDRIPQEHPTKLRFYEMRAPFKGRVIQRNITLGELVGNNIKAYTIANFDRAWVEIDVHPNDLQYLKEDQLIEITTQDGMKMTTKIAHFNPTISEETRTATAVAVIDNNSGRWTPGKFISASIQREATPVSILVSKEAIQQIRGEDHIFIVDGESFIPRVVKIGRTDEKNVEILSGLEQDEIYADNNTFLLKAEYEKGEAEHTH